MEGIRALGEELEAMIWDRCLEAGMNLQGVRVSPSKAYGWEANYIAAPHS